MPSDYLKIERAAFLIDVSPWTIRKWIREHKIRVYRFGGAVRIKAEDLHTFAVLTPCREDLMKKSHGN
jgi:excisionase family DNA binding protein